MARGKYAVRAANRLAEIDAGLVEELRAKLAAVTAERDTARAEIERLSRDRAADAQRVGAELAAEQVRELAEQLAAERAARAADRERFADEVFAVFRSDNSKLSYRGYGRVAAVFGQTHRLGPLITGPERPGNRNARRTNGSKVRLLAEASAKDTIPKEYR